MRPAVFLLVAAASAACASSALSEPRTPKAELKLQNWLQGKVAGAPVSCLSPYRAERMTIIDDNTVLFRAGGKTVYRNDPPGGCYPMGGAGYSLVTRTPGSALCSGDIAQVIDLRTGFSAGACALGDFVPYRTARL